ncbi:short chain dehydrogenase sol3 [Podospora australis]|uniref:Short chain dehydrogenase sol3 n=1 Tax=Podospora australis TaxID=1536484 RepID=A0AAN6WPM7_9PEZI|nr:short chain dehydrogenase sol3 [Podospora australis]
MSQFDVTPEKQASLPRYIYRQITFKPVEVNDADLKGQTAIVTGSNTGVGFETGRQLLNLGLSRLILAVRNEDKGEAAAEKLSVKGDGSKREGVAIEVWKLDHSDYSSVTAFAERVKNTLDRLDIAILNVGMVTVKRTFNPKTKHDEIIQVNYLSNSLLAILLLPAVKKTRPNQPAPTRITFTSSESSTWAKYKLDSSSSILEALDKPDDKVDPTDRMFVSKLLGQFFLQELAKRVPTSVAVINAASPGAIHDSDFNRELDETPAGAVIKKVLRRIANTSAVGARMMIDAAVKHGAETHGQFLSFQKMVPMATILYTKEGEKLSAQLWKETLDEFKFADVERILAEVSQ